MKKRVTSVQVLENPWISGRVETFMHKKIGVIQTHDTQGRNEIPWLPVPLFHKTHKRKRAPQPSGTLVLQLINYIHQMT